MKRRIGWGKVFSFEVGCGTLVLTVVAGVILYLIWAPLAYLAIPLGVLLWTGVVTDPNMAVRCPHCHERMNLGASVCHHCGRDLVPPS